MRYWIGIMGAPSRRFAALIALAALTGCSVVFSPDGEGARPADSGGGGPADGGAPGGADGAPADAPGAVKQVFLTSVFYNGAFGGLAGADAACQARAEEAQLEGDFRAWLSGPEDAYARMTQSDAVYVLTTGLPVAMSWSDLTDGSLLRAIDRTEFGTPLESLPYVCVGGEVWTNTSPDGAVAGADDCNGWTIGDPSSRAVVAGNLRFADSRWSQSECTPVSCYTSLPLYCIEQ